MPASWHISLGSSPSVASLLLGCPITPITPASEGGDLSHVGDSIAHLTLYVSLQASRALGFMATGVFAHVPERGR